MNTNNVPRRTKLIVILVLVYVWIFITNAMFQPERMPAIIGYPLLGYVVYLIVKKISRKGEEERIKGLFQFIKTWDLEGYIVNFINRFSFEGKGVDGWRFRNRRIDWDRIDDLERYLLEKRVPLKSDKKRRDILTILESYIQSKEESLTRESIKREPQSFSSLSGKEFEKLLYRLFEALGYKVELIGGSGDQGGDLIINRDGKRILVQAKCYRDWSVGNDAVQQVVGAMKFYDCSETMVVATSAFFTPQAYALARANRTQLISKTMLSELLMKNLKENWG